MKNKVIALLILLLITNSMPIWAGDSDYSIGNEIQKEEFPESEDVEPTSPTFVIKGGVEEVTDINLEECLRCALGNNPRIQAALQDVFASDARIKQAWSAYFPQFSWQTGYTRIKQLQLSDALGRNLIFNYYVLGQITASQMLYDFGVTQNIATIRKLDNQGYKIMLTGTVNDVVCEVKKAYYNLQYALEAKKVAQEMVLRYEAFYNQAKGFYVAGTSPKVDVTIAEVNLSNSKLMLIQAENAVEIAMAKLNNAMGLPYSNRYNISDNLKYNPCDITLTEAIDVARESRPEFQLAEVKVEEARQNVKLVKKSYFPQLTVEGQYQIGGRSFTSNYGYNVGSYLNFPTINGMLIRNEIKEAKALHSREQAQASNTKNNIYYEIQQAFYSMVEKKNSIPVSFLGLKQAKENYDLSYGRYKVGVGNPVELKEAQVQYQNAMLQYYNSLYQFNSARADLEKYIGKNLANGEVQLDSQQNNLNTKKRSKKKS
ncbi:MAG: TolC family protein [Cyanobacteria bacterium SIG31]|nr:TolC family protein [Cyanobacteria bacterium SIG31]